MWPAAASDHFEITMMMMKHMFTTTERLDSHPVTTKICPMQVNSPVIISAQYDIMVFGVLKLIKLGRAITHALIKSVFLAVLK